MIYSKTPMGVVELTGAHGSLPLHSRQLLIMIDGLRSFDELCEIFGEERVSRTLADLKSRGFVQRKESAVTREFPAFAGAAPAHEYPRSRPAPPTLNRALAELPKLHQATRQNLRAHTPPATLQDFSPDTRPNTQLMTRPGTISARTTIPAPTWTAPPMAPARAAAATRGAGKGFSAGSAVMIVGFGGCAVIMMFGAFRLWRSAEAMPAIVAAADPLALPAASKPITFPEPEPSPAPQLAAPARPAHVAPRSAGGTASEAPVAAIDARPGADAGVRAATSVKVRDTADAPPPSSAATALPPTAASAPATAGVAATPAAAPAERSEPKPPAVAESKPAPAEPRIELAKAVPTEPRFELAKAAPDAAAAQPQEAGGAPAPLHVRNRVLPEISLRARRAGIAEGSIEVLLYVSPAGAVDRVELVKAEPPRIFDSQMRDALQQWTFDPPGTPSRARVSFDFKP